MPLVLTLAACSGGNDTPVPLPSPAACGSTPESAYANLFSDVYAPACPVDSGSGAMGSWQTDAHGLPVYRYGIDQLHDPRARYFTSWGDSRDHWHQVGNEAITATAHNGGYLQFWDWRRGGKCVNRFQPERQNFSGGFRFLKSGGEVWNTLYDPQGFDSYERVFGVGYFQKETVRNGLRVVETTHAPAGAQPLLVSETEIHNQSGESREVLLYEYWDFNLYQLLLAPVMTAPLGAIFEALRWLFNLDFQVDTLFDPGAGFLAAAPAVAPGVSTPPEDSISIPDYYPPAVFLAARDQVPEFIHTDQDRFFGRGGLTAPDAVSAESPSLLLPPASRDIGKACLVLGKRLRLAPGEKARVAYAFGSGRLESIAALVAAWRASPADSLRTTLDHWTRRRADFVGGGPEAEWLRRETLWHSTYLPAGAFFEDYFEGPIVNQGSAYAYIQGLNGAHRDFALFTLPLVYLDPELARAVISYSLRSQDAETGKLPYAHQGYGYAGGYLVHEESTDLDLFLLMAVGEYLGATRDFAFLDEVLPYYPLSSGRRDPVREHLRMALDHLEYEVGTGPNGLIRVGSGDWNDVLIAFSPDPLATMRQGESNLNTGMACFLFPRLSRLFEPLLPELAGRLATLGETWCNLLEGEWAGDWMRRGSLGDGTYMGEDRLFLDAQPWPLLAGLWDEAQTSTLLDNIGRLLVDPSPAGALCLHPPYPPPLVQGSDTNGGTWAAVDSWLAWAWALHDPDRAWPFFLGTTMHRHAEAYPEVWYGIWSGPDSFNASYADRPGETFNWSLTPMTDFPVMNMNRHSGPLLDVIRLAGIDPLGDRIGISPLLPFEEFSLRLPLLGLAYLGDRHRGVYRPVAAGTFRFRVRLPAGLGEDNWRLLVDGAPAAAFCLQGHLEFEAPGEPGRPLRWEILPQGQ